MLHKKSARVRTAPRPWQHTFAAALALGAVASCSGETTSSLDVQSTTSQALSAGSAGPVNSVAGNNKCLDVYVGSPENGTAVQLATCYGNQAQAWTYTGSMLQVFGNKCLDVTGGQAANGTKLQIWECSATNENQQWARVGQTFVNRGKYCLDLPDGNAADNTPIQIWECGAGNRNQMWNFSGTAGNDAPANQPQSQPQASAPAPSGNSSDGGNAAAQPGNAVNVMDFGVKADGNSDNTQALQRAFDAAKSMGKSVWIPAGNYAHSGTLTIDGIAVAGAGSKAILHATQKLNSAIILTGNNPSPSYVATTVSSDQRSSQPKDCAVLISYASGAQVSYVNVQGASANGIRVDRSSNSQVHHNFVNGTNADGICLVNGTTGSMIKYNQVMNASDDSYSSNSYAGEPQSSGNTFANNYAGPNYHQGRGFCFMGSANETITRNVSEGSLWLGIVAGTSPNDGSQRGFGFNITDNLILRNASGNPVQLTSDSGMNYDGSVGQASGNKTSGDIAQVLGWTPSTNVPSPASFSAYAGGGPGSNNTPGNRQ